MVERQNDEKLMTSRTSTPGSAGRSRRPSAAALRPVGERGHAISSPVSSTKTSSRFAGRRSPSGVPPLAAFERRIATDVPVRRVRRPPRCASASTSRSFAPAARRPRPPRAPACSATSSRRRAAGDGLAVRHDRHRVGEPLGLLDVVRRHQDRDALAAQRVDQRPQLLADLRVQADGRLVEQHQPRAVHERAGDQQPAAHAAGELVDARVAAVGELRDLQRPLDRRRARSARGMR